MEREQVIEVLGEFAKGWFGNSQQHAIFSAILEDRGYSKLAAKWAEESEEEYAEALECVKRIVALGGKPVVACEDYPVYDDIRDQLKADLDDANQALPAMAKIAAEIDDDQVTSDMIAKFAADEEDHRLWVRQHLGFIEEIGWENYLIQQM